jgi:hypothetical protein
VQWDRKIFISQNQAWIERELSQQGDDDALRAPALDD